MDQQASKSGWSNQESSNTTTNTNSYSYSRLVQAESGSGHHLKNELVATT